MVKKRSHQITETRKLKKINLFPFPTRKSEPFLGIYIEQLCRMEMYFIIVRLLITPKHAKFTSAFIWQSDNLQKGLARCKTRVETKAGKQQVLVPA